MPVAAEPAATKRPDWSAAMEFRVALVAPEGLAETFAASQIAETEGEWRGGKRAPVLVFWGRDRLRRDRE